MWTGAAGCGTGGVDVVVVFGVGVLAGNRTGAGFDDGVLGVAEWCFSGGVGCFSFPLDTGGVGI